MTLKTHQETWIYKESHDTICILIIKVLCAVMVKALSWLLMKGRVLDSLWMIKSAFKIWKQLLTRVGIILTSQARFKIHLDSSQMNHGKVNQKAERVHPEVQLLLRLSSDLLIDRAWRLWMNIQIHLRLYALVICLIQLQRQTIHFSKPSKASFSLKMTKRLRANLS